ncbi:MAG: hypothetical protein AB7G08_28350, partial [Hyphomicrobiaceae bacterium]
YPMGIDIYATWRDQTSAESDAQATGFSAVHGHVGYLREAYHGGPYVTMYFVAEAFDSPDGEATIQASVLRDRLPAAVLMHLYREHKLYGDGKDPATVTDVAALTAAITAAAGATRDVSHTEFVEALKPESIATATQLIEGGILPESARAFVEFTKLCERKERELGEPCRIVASY